VKNPESLAMLGCHQRLHLCSWLNLKYPTCQQGAALARKLRQKWLLAALILVVVELAVVLGRKTLGLEEPSPSLPVLVGSVVVEVVAATVVVAAMVRILLRGSLTL